MASQPRSLIVGSSGQVGNQIALALGLDQTIRTVRRNPGDHELVLDLLALAEDPQAARRLVLEHEVDAVYCAAAMTHVDGCESDPDTAMKANCHAPASLAAAAAEAQVPFVFFSTEYIFDGKSGPYEENAPANPISVYGKSKFEGEQAVQEAHPNALILRTTVVYGVDPARKNFLYQLRKACAEKSRLRAPADQVSTPTYNRDVAEAAIRLVRAGQCGVFNVAGPERLNRFEFAKAAVRVMGLPDSHIEPVMTVELHQSARRPLSAGLRTEKLARTLPELRMHSVEEGVRAWLSQDGADRSL